MSAFEMSARRTAVRALAALVALVAAGAGPGPALATPEKFPGFTRATTALLSHLDAPARFPAPTAAPAGGEAPAAQQQEEEQRQPPAAVDPEAGLVFSIYGGSVFSGRSAFQTGGALAYFFGDKANFGFEIEGGLIFGPGGRVTQVMGSVVGQTGARTSKFVPYVAVGIGYLRASTQLRSRAEEVLNDLGIVPQPQTETAPFLHFGGGLRFFVRPNIAFRADVRFSEVKLDLPDASLGDSLFPMSRVAGMVSWNF